MREFRDQTFTRKVNRGNLSIDELRFHNCTFDNCLLSLTNNPSEMARISRVELQDCYSLNSTIGPCYLSDVVVENLKTGDIMIVWGALFRHVILKGKIGSLKVNSTIHDPHASTECQRRFDEIRAAYYSKLDWALDISGAKPLMLDLHGIPAARIVINSETQIVISRERLNDVRQVRSIGKLDATVSFMLEQFIDGEEHDMVLAAPTGRAPKYYKPVLESFSALKDAKIIE